MDRVITWIFLAFGMIAALDRIFGNRLGLGKEFEKGMMMLGTLTLSMTGMLTVAPLIKEGLSILPDIFPPFFDFSILPASLLANDMGGAHLAQQLAADADVGIFNGLVVASMMGCTVSFTLPFVLQATDESVRKDVFFGLLCGIVAALNYIGCASVCIASAALIAYIPLLIVVLGVFSFALSTAGGLLGGLVMCWLSKGKINPLIGSAGVSAVPMAARVANVEGQKANSSNFLLMHAMGPNVAGVIGSAIAAGFLLSVFG